MNERYQRGWEQLKAIDGSQGEKVIHNLATVAPDIAKYIIEFAFGDIYSRKVLDLKQRELLTLAALTSMGDCTPQLKVHLHAALNVGLDHEEIIESLIHCIPYTGFPRVLNAITAAKEVFAERSEGQ